MNIEVEVRILLFSRWLILNYSNEELNNENSLWFKSQLQHFNDVVYPNYIKNGTVKEHIKMFETGEIIEGVINDPLL